MAEQDRGIEQKGDHPATQVVGPPLELHQPTPAAKQLAAKELATSDEKMVKANVLPPLPDFPKPESLDGKENKTFASSDLNACTKYDPSGKATSKETTWTDAKGQQHDVVEGSGVTTNTIVDGANTAKLITHADGSWEHEVNTPGHATITKVEKDHTVSQTERDLKKGESHELVTHPNGFTEEIVTKKGFKESQTKDSAGVLRFDAIVASKTADGKFDYHLNKRLDHKGGVLSDDSHWKDKKGVYHEDDTLNFGDHTSIHSVTTGDTTKTTTTKPDGKSNSVLIKADGTTTDLSTGETRKPDALDQPGR